MSKSLKSGVYLFKDDCRLHDSHALQEFCSHVEQAVFLYHWSPQIYWCNQTNYSAARQRFLLESLIELDKELAKHNQQLFIIAGNASGSRSTKRFEYFYESFLSLCQFFNISVIAYNRSSGSYEEKKLRHLKSSLSQVDWIEKDSNTLFDLSQMVEAYGGNLENLPLQFTPFRKVVESLDIRHLTNNINCFPKLPQNIKNIEKFAVSFSRFRDTLSVPTNSVDTFFSGGTASASRALHNYFSQSGVVLRYKETRNALDEVFASTRFSPWLANGNLSVRELHRRIKNFESEVHANDSTYWLIFELLWREFFHWRAMIDKEKLFRLSGVAGKALNQTFYPQRFAAWCAGTTESALVNAGMHQLVETGWISNRARQITASYLVNELELDWRYGAAFFEKHLLDYDVASNYGNWQYIAGVGADPRGGRHFNIEKQAELFDPDGQYRRRWGGDMQKIPLDDTDAADWPSI